MAAKASPKARGGEGVGALTHRAKRKNLPPAGIESHGKVREEAPHRYEFNPHLPPALRSAPEAKGEDALPPLLREARERALTGEEARQLAEALRRREPWLEWAGKRERPWFEVDPVALHMHERVSVQAMLRALRRKEVSRGLFGDPELEYAKAVQFYRHEVDWTNRLVLGDSLQVMASLARREDLAGRVQTIFLDPPYGINYRSNFQPSLTHSDVKDREQDLTREPETVKAYRDTWTLGVHSYLGYLRDRLAMARELLADTGSVFVQISDEHVHLVRNLLDEVFGPANCMSLISFRTKIALNAAHLPNIADYLLWYAKDRERVKFRRLFLPRQEGAGTQFSQALLPNGDVVKAGDLAEGPDRAEFFSMIDLMATGYTPSCHFEFTLDGRPAFPNPTTSWKTNPQGMRRLLASGRVRWQKTVPRYVFRSTDYPVMEITNQWSDTQGATGKIFAVQTATKVVERCLLMTTDPGDLVLDPTCGSGTTAFVAEQWGRRWIAMDTSRVALTLAKHRLMTAKFEYYRLREPTGADRRRNPDGPWLSGHDEEGRPTGEPRTLACRTASHITLGSIARNDSLDPVFEKHEPILTEALAGLNDALEEVSEPLKAELAAKLIAKHRAEGTRAVTDGDLRRWLLPGASLADARPEPARRGSKALTAAQLTKYRERIPPGPWREWEVPFDADPDYPAALRDALAAYRKAWRAKMDEVNACIAANAESEELVDRPEVEKGAVRVAGPFSVEGVIAVEDGPDSPVDSPIGGAPDELDAFPAGDEERSDLAVRNGEAHIAKVIRLLRASGVDFPGNGTMRFRRLEAASGALVHAEGEWEDGGREDGREDRRVAVSVGPEFGNLTSLQVERAMRDANMAGYDEVVFAGFGFDAAAQEAIEGGEHPNLTAHAALINPDVAMEELLKTQPGSQIFTVFAAPRVAGPVRAADGEYTVVMEGMDVYDPVDHEVHATNRDRVAAWFVDTDYDGRTFCICQAFFPDRSKWQQLARALGGLGLVERGAFEALTGFESLPFRRPERLGPGGSWRVAVKVIDPRGVEGLRVLTLEDPPADSSGSASGDASGDSA